MSKVSSSRQSEADALEQETGGPSEPPATNGPAAELDRLRRLLLAPEQDDLAQVHDRLEDLEQREVVAEDISRLLPEAVVLRTREDDHLAQALAPMMEDSLRNSVERNPKPLADALFPIFGPAIRRSISEALRAMLEAVNRTIEHSLSVDSLKWRWEAWRTGRPFSEIVLSHTLRYRVEQVFLIDQETGLPLQYVVAEAVEAQDSALVSSMLTAIQDFVEDSFGTEDEGGTLNTMQVGDLTVWIEEGPEAILAAVIRGIPAPALREVLQDILETVHLQFNPELVAFDGNPDLLAGTQPLLEKALLAQYEEKTRKTPLGLWVLLALIVGALAFWGITSMQNQARWNDYLTMLDEEAGIVVTSQGRSGGQWFVRGLRDPLARDPADVLALTTILPDEVRGEWEAYQALDSVFVVQRAVRVLEPPASVQLRLEESVLTATGSASHEWIEEAQRRARFVAGIASYEDVALQDDDVQQVQALAATLERQTLRFGTGSTQLVAGQDAALEALVADVLQLQEAAVEVNRQVRFQVLGHASFEGDAVTNQRISQQRAEAVRQVLIQQGLPAGLVEAVGTGTQHASEEQSEEDRAANRRVSFRIVLEES